MCAASFVWSSLSDGHEALRLPTGHQCCPCMLSFVRALGCSSRPELHFRGPTPCSTAARLKALMIVYIHRSINHVLNPSFGRGACTVQADTGVTPEHTLTWACSSWLSTMAPGTGLHGVVWSTHLGCCPDVPLLPPPWLEACPGRVHSQHWCQGSASPAKRSKSCWAGTAAFQNTDTVLHRSIPCPTLSQSSYKRCSGHVIIMISKLSKLLATVVQNRSQAELCPDLKCGSCGSLWQWRMWKIQCTKMVCKAPPARRPRTLAAGQTAHYHQEGPR